MNKRRRWKAHRRRREALLLRIYGPPLATHDFSGLVLCDECDGAGWYMDAPGRALDGRMWQQTCHVCGGSGSVAQVAAHPVGIGEVGISSIPRSSKVCG
jgi:hypothetical protein